MATSTQSIPIFAQNSVLNINPQALYAGNEFLIRLTVRNKKYRGVIGRSFTTRRPNPAIASLSLIPASTTDPNYYNIYVKKPDPMYCQVAQVNQTSGDTILFSTSPIMYDTMTVSFYRILTRMVPQDE